MKALTENDTDLRVIRLVELIAHINGTIQEHSCAAQPRPEVIDEYLYRRAEYLAELTELLGEGYAIRADLRPIDQSCGMNDCPVAGAQIGDLQTHGRSRRPRLSWDFKISNKTFVMQNQNKTRIFCNRCNGKTNHQIRASHSVDIYEQIDDAQQLDSTVFFKSWNAWVVKRLALEN